MGHIYILFILSAFWYLCLVCSSPCDNNLFTDGLNKIIKAGSEELAENGSKNFLLSPVSVQRAILLLYSGSAGTTLDEIRRALELPEGSTENTENNTLSIDNCIFRSDSTSGVQIDSVNSVYIKTGMRVNPTYIQTLQNKYKAIIKEKALVGIEPEVNSDVSRVTHGMIPQILSPGSITELTRMILINALYFKGAWKDSFVERKTRQADFHVSNSTKIRVDFMERSFQNLSYSESDNGTIIELPYSDEQFSMFLLLPKVELETMLVGNFKMLSNSLANPEGMDKLQFNVFLPKFDLKSEAYDLKNTVTKMGLGSLYGSPDLSRITDERIAVSKVVHKVAVKINEVGTEASAATAVIVAGRSLGGPRIGYFRANRPFYFLIGHKPSKTPLFIGFIKNPIAS